MDSRGLQSKRLQKEMAKLSKLPPMGVVCYVAGEGNDLRALEAKVNPPEGTPYEEGCFKLSVTCGDRYPNEPPNVWEGFVFFRMWRGIFNHCNMYRSVLSLPSTIQTLIVKGAYA